MQMIAVWSPQPSRKVIGFEGHGPCSNPVSPFLPHLLVTSWVTLVEFHHLSELQFFSSTK